jgi:hypothetical protein
MKIMEDIHNVYFEHFPTNLEKTHKKTIKDRSLVPVKGFHHLKNLSLLERLLQPSGLLPHLWTQKRGHPTQVANCITR